MAKLKFLGADSGRLPRMDRYELVAEIATGGMATVFLGRILGVGGFERFVAIKRLHPHLGADDSFVKMFLDEARLVANIRHQHVVPVMEVGGGDDGYYLVMEYIEGDTLATLLSRSSHAKQRIPAKAAVRIVLDTLAGLHAAHELVDPNGDPVGLVHRDVSPQNILIDVHGVSRIADFGVAHATSRLGSTRAGQLKGKVAYMAPEQARGDLVTRRADVFAAAIVLWEALCMKRLFLADNEAVTLNRLIFEPIPKLRAGNPAMPASLEKVLDKALDRHANDRYSSAAEFAEALESAARAARMLGDTNDVKAFLADMIGENIEQRRSAIRAHLAFVDQPREEPEAPPAPPAPPPRPARPEVVMPPPGSTASSAAMTLPAVPDDGDELGVEDVRLETSPGAAVEFPRPKRAWPILAAVMSAVALGAVVVAVMASRAPADDGTTHGPVAGPAASPLAALAEVSVAPPAADGPDATALEASPPAASAEADAAVQVAAPATTTTPRTGGRAPEHPKDTGTPATETAPPATAPPATAPPTATNVAPADTDDLKKNPYR